MIVTLTVNPSLDETTSVERVELGPKLRCTRPEVQPGGGGLNVARVAHRLGEETLALWTCGGSQGQRLGELLDAEGVPHRPVPIARETRRSLTVDERTSGRQLRLVYPGPELTAGEAERICTELDHAIDGGDVLVLSGSLPPGLDAGFYARAAHACARCRTIVDTHGEPLRRALEAHPYLIKPNAGELAELVGRDLDSDDAVIAAARDLLDAVEAVVVSLAERGALLITRERTEHLPAPEVEVASAVGAGDSMVAGIAVGLARGWDLDRAVALGVAAGAAAVTTPGSDLAHRQTVEALLTSAPGAR